MADKSEGWMSDEIKLCHAEIEHLQALNEELVEIMEEAIAYGDWPLWSERARAAIAKARKT